MSEIDKKTLEAIKAEVREELMAEWKQEQSERKQAKTPGSESSSLNRPSPLSQGRSKREHGMLWVFLIILGVIAVVLVMSGEKESKGLTQQEEEFEVVTRKAPRVPHTPPPLPAEAPAVIEDKIDKKALALREARLKSAIVIFNNQKPTRAQATSGHPEDPDDADPNRRFRRQAQKVSVPVSKAMSLGNMNLRILQGKLIDATLETAVNSDLPGMVRAIVSYDIYGESGREVLLPKGSRLVGEYNSTIRKGQARVFVIWNRVVTPDGIEVALHSGGTDPLGRAGIKGRVNNHFWQIFSTSALLSIIGAGTANIGVSTTDRFNSASAYRAELAKSFNDSASQVLERYIDIPPTIKIKHGARIKVFVARDLDFSEVMSDPSNYFRQATSNQKPWVIRP